MNTGWQSNPEPPYTSGKDEMSDHDYELLTKARQSLALAGDWLEELDEGMYSTDAALKKIAEAMSLLRNLI